MTTPTMQQHHSFIWDSLRLLQGFRQAHGNEGQHRSHRMYHIRSSPRLASPPARQNCAGALCGLWTPRVWCGVVWCVATSSVGVYLLCRTVD